MRRRRTLTVAVAMTLLMVACTTDQDNSDEDSELSPRTSMPGDNVTVLTGQDAGELAIRVSQALYDHAPVVVLADAADEQHQRQAGETAGELGVPVLLTPSSRAGDEELADGASEDEASGDEASGDEGEAVDVTAGGDGPLRDELARLKATTVVTVGDSASAWAQDLDESMTIATVATGGQGGGGGAMGSELGTGGTGPEAAAGAIRGFAGAVAASDLPAVTPPDPLTGLAVLTPDKPHTIAAAATARAAGARVLVTATTDPRSDPAVIEAMADRPPTHTMALGEEFGPVEALRNRVAVAATGVQLPGGGQTVYPGRMLVALYGHPGSTVLGALGEQTMDETIERARKVAASYESLVDVPVVPTLEIITTVASAGAGPEGDYSWRTPVEDLRPWVEAAAEADVYVVLDLQPGHTDFLTQAKEYEELLRYPHVGLALDPEWRLAPDQRHMVNIGSVDGDEVNEVVDWLADLVTTHTLPQKLLILHQFTLRMITNRDAVETGRDEVAVLIHADGFGTPGQKLDTWRALRADRPDGAWWGWKNFYDEDRPMLSPAETIAVDPSPLFVSYQ